MALRSFGKAYDDFVLEQNFINACVQVNRACLLGKSRVKLIVFVKRFAGCTNAVCQLKEAAIGKCSKLAIRQNGYQGVKLLFASLLIKGGEEVLQRLSVFTVAVFIKLVKCDLVELITALVKLLEICFFGGNKLIGLFALVFGFKVIIQFIGNDAALFHCVIRTGIEAEHVQ